MGSNQDRGFSRRYLLATVGAGTAAGLAGCSGDDDEENNRNGEENNRDGEEDSPNGDEEVDLGLGLEVTGDNVFTYNGSSYQNGPAVAAGEAAVIECELPDEYEKKQLDVIGKSTNIECGEILVLDEEGEYNLSLGVLGDSGDVDTAETSYVVIETPSIQASNLPDEVTAGEKVTLVYEVTGTDVQASHNATMPRGDNIAGTGKELTLEPEQTGQIQIESTAENPAGLDEIIEELEVTEDLEGLQEKNLEKRKKVAGSLAGGTVTYQFYDTEIFRSMLPEEDWKHNPESRFITDQNDNNSIHSNLEFVARGNANTKVRGEWISGFLVKSFSELNDESLQDIYRIHDYEQVDNYRGAEIYRLGSNWSVMINREENYMLGTTFFEDNILKYAERMIDLWEDGVDGETALDDTLWHQNEMKYDDLVVAEAIAEDIGTRQIDEDGFFQAQTVDQNSEVTEKHYSRKRNHDTGEREMNLIAEREGIPLENLVIDYGENVAFKLP